MIELLDLRASNGEVFGSDSYFRSLNKSCIFAGFDHFGSSHRYYDFLNNSKSNLQSHVDKVFSDTKKYAAILQYIDSGKRRDLIAALRGCIDYVKIIGSSLSGADECIRYLELANSATRPKSGASSHKIDSAMKLITDSSNRLSKSDRTNLVKRALDYGIRNAVNNDKDYAAFFAVLMAGESEQFLRDVWTKYQFQQKQQSYSGYNGRDFCSTEYVNEFERDIFCSRCLSTGRGNRDYGKYARDDLKRVVVIINLDMGRGILGMYCIKRDNKARIKEAAHQLQQCQFPSNSINIDSINRYDIDDIKDITLELRQLMERGEQGYLADKRHGLTGPSLIKKFITQVRTGGEYDIKNQGWNDDWYIYDERIVRFDAPGNILFGYLARVVGFPEQIALAGAGGYQALSWFKDSESTQLGTLRSYLDDPYDQAMIRLGVEYYNSTH